MLIFIIAFCAVAYLARGIWRALRSPEFKRDVRRMREMRRVRKASRR